MLIPASPAITLAMQLILLRLTMTSDYCSTALMTDRLTQLRTAALAASLQRAALPVLAALQPSQSSHLDTALLQGKMECRIN